MYAGVSSAWCGGAGESDRPKKRDESDMTVAQLARRVEFIAPCLGGAG